jgi:hypothetical protein
MPVRGYVRSKMWYFLKVGAMNTRRVLEWAKEQVSLPYFYLFRAVTIFFNLEKCLRSRQLVLSGDF